MPQKRPLALLLGASIVLMLSGLLAPARAQQSGAEPGATDPVGPPSNYITLRTDDLLVGKYAGGNVNQLDTYQVNVQNQLSTQISNASGSGVLGLGNSVSASGRILGQDNDQAVNLGRSADGKSLEVRFPLGGAFDLPKLHTAIKNVPDLVSVAVGDLDKVADANGVNHDEVVVAYAQDFTGTPFLYVNVAVLNYTSNDDDGSQPLFVNSATANALFQNNFSSTISDGFSVAIGDFDGNGQNEIAVATVGPSNSGIVYLSIFRYTHASLTDTPTLQEITHAQFNFALSSGGGSNTADFLPTISLMAGDFEGVGNKAELVLALENRVNNGGSLEIQNVLQAIDVDTNLKPTLRGRLVENTYSTSSSQGTLTSGKLTGLAGLFKYDPANGFDLYRREVALVNNERQPVSNDSNAKLDIKAYQVASDLSSFTPLFNGQKLQLPDNGVGAKFDATAGGLAVDGNINTPLWSLAIAQLQSGSLPETVTTIGVGTNLAVASATNFSSSCCGGGTVATDNALRPTVQAYDYEGRTTILGSPVRLTVNNVINTDFVLQEPPKHAYWDEAAGQLNIVSRVPTIAASLTNSQGVSFSGKSTDTSAYSVGGSVAASASSSLSEGGGAFKIKSTVDITAKASYSFDQNESSYNSSYSSRTLSETESTDNDDFVSGRSQLIDIWRYRLLGVPAQDENGNDVNIYYDVVMPGPIVNFKASGLDLDWYQPSQENGNILSYPAPSNNTFTPLDLGTYGVPCQGSNDPDCFQTQTGPMIPATAEFISDTSGTIGLDYSNSTGTGSTVSYSHKLSTSLDVKYSYSADTSLAFSSNTSRSVAVNFNSSNSWGNTSTTDSTTTSATGIKIARSAISSAQAYEFFPTVYTTLDGTIKVSHAVDPLGSNSGKSFWATLYGAKPDPALNLPLRFVRSAVTSSGTTWIPNTLISRKQMRGFFLMTADPDPVTGEYDILSQAPVDGDQVRLSAQVYDYSTAKSFSSCLVEFYAIKYDSASNTESGERKLIGSTTISLPPRGTAPAQIVWDTIGFGPGSGGQDYRIYVRLNYDNSIDAIYPPEDPGKVYAPGLPTGVDPGQNKEGWGVVTIMAPAALQSSTYAQPADLHFGSRPLTVSRLGKSSGNRLVAGVPLQLKAQVCARGFSRDSTDVVVFDGDPTEGNVIAWKRMYVPNKGKCSGTSFNWTPRRGVHKLLAAILPSRSPLSGASSTKRRLKLQTAKLKINVR